MMQSGEARDKPHPLCLLHIQKSGGLSVERSLERALPAGSISPKRHDSSYYAGFTDFDRLTGWAREAFVGSEEDLEAMRGFRVVTGHFALGTLLQLAPSEAVATVLREPRSRLLSLYMYWRLTPGMREVVAPFTAMSDLAAGPLDAFLDCPDVGHTVDNHLCRTLLRGSGDAPSDTFIAPEAVETVAAAAIERLESLGFVGVLEVQDGLWDGLSRHFGVQLEPVRANAIGSRGVLTEALPAPIDFTPALLELLQRRTAADAIVYDHALTRLHGTATDTHAIRDAAFASELAKYGDVAGRSAAQRYSVELRPMRGTGKRDYPLCFMNLPKSGGVSVHEALERALPRGSISPYRHDGSNYAGFDLRRLRGWARNTYAHSDEHVRRMCAARFVSGHFGLDTLLRIAPSSAIATVLREPRARLLSLYAYWRLTPHARLRDVLAPYDAVSDAALGSLDSFLADARIAQETDNQLCRALLHKGLPVATTEFIPVEHHSELAAAAARRLETLGFVGILERPDALWTGLSRFFGESLSPQVSNATGSSGVQDDVVFQAVPITPLTVELLDHRTAADTVLYEQMLSREGLSPAEIEALRQVAFAAQLVRFGDATGGSAERALQRGLELRKTQNELVAQTEEVARLEVEHGLRVAALTATESELRARISELTEGGERLREEIANQGRVIDWLRRDGWPLIAVRGRLRAELTRLPFRRAGN